MAQLKGTQVDGELVVKSRLTVENEIVADGKFASVDGDYLMEIGASHPNAGTGDNNVHRYIQGWNRNDNKAEPIYLNPLGGDIVTPSKFSINRKGTINNTPQPLLNVRFNNTTIPANDSQVQARVQMWANNEPPKSDASGNGEFQRFEVTLINTVNPYDYNTFYLQHDYIGKDANKDTPGRIRRIVVEDANGNIGTLGNVICANTISSGVVVTDGKTDKCTIDITGHISAKSVTATTFSLTGDYASIQLGNGSIVGSTSSTITGGTFNAVSDMRLKENFQSLRPEKSILDLPTYKFDFINGFKNQIGCKAQDLREICPEIVTEGSDGYLSIQESKIVYLLLEEVKKLRKEVDELRGE